jgi:hypothetical protein
MPRGIDPLKEEADRISLYDAIRAAIQGQGMATNRTALVKGTLPVYLVVAIGPLADSLEQLVGEFADQIRQHPTGPTGESADVPAP